MSSEIDAVIEGLAGSEGVTRACQTAEEWAETGRVSDLLTLATALEERGDAKQAAIFESVADHVEDQVALTQSDAAVDAVLALSLGDRTKTVRVPRPRAVRLRAFASRLGYGQTSEMFLSTLARVGHKHEHEELLACWMYEVILRGTSLEREPQAIRFREHLAAQKHPLATMPLTLLPVEREAPSYMPLYGEKGLGSAIESLESGAMSVRTIPPPADGATVRTMRIDDPEIVQRLGTAVRPWIEGSNGKVEAKVFSVEPAVARDGIGGWLLRVLALDAIAGVPRPDVSVVPAEAIFGALFSAASNGGAYSAGLGGAYGRRAAWTSLGALVSAGEGASIEEIVRLASECAFLSFIAHGPWFFDVAWDLGAVALRPDGKSVAVLAATDKD